MITYRNEKKKITFCYNDNYVHLYRFIDKNKNFSVNLRILRENINNLHETIQSHLFLTDTQFMAEFLFDALSVEKNLSKDLEGSSFPSKILRNKKRKNSFSKS